MTVARIKRPVLARQEEISSEVVRQLKEEGLYPYPDSTTDPTQLVERQTFDLVVTVARSALPPRGTPRKLSVSLIHAALEKDPSDLGKILDKVLSLTPEEREHLSRLLDQTELSDVISAASTVTSRLNFLGGLRKIFADSSTRGEFREIDQLHPMVAQNLWLFGEEWTLARPEVELTSALAAHLELLGADVALEGKLKTVRRGDGRTGRVDVVLYRGIGDERANERLVVELKRPSVRIAEDELAQITSYARAIVDDPQFSGTKCRWKFILVGYDIHPRIFRDIRRKGWPEGLADDQEEYQVWVQKWGEIFDAAERKLSFFRKQLKYQATDERVTEYLHASHEKYLPASMRQGERPGARRVG